MREGQLAGAIQIRIERPKHGAESSALIFGPSKDPQLAAKGRELKRLLGINPDLRELKVIYGGYSGKDDEIDMMTRSMLQIMLEFAAIVQVPEADVAQGKAGPGLVDTQGAGALNGPPLRVLVTDTPPQDAYVARYTTGDGSGSPHRHPIKIHLRHHHAAVLDRRYGSDGVGARCHHTGNQ